MSIRAGITLAHNLETGFGSKCLHHPFAKQGMIVNDDNADRFTHF
jgi:hypothetical protein